MLDSLETKMSKTRSVIKKRSKKEGGKYQHILSELE